jgi:molybdopterin synthase catalytic subunit
MASIVRPPLRYDDAVTDHAPPSERALVRVTSEPIVVDEALAAVADPGAGGTAVFIGTVRDHSEAGDVTGLSYEAWDDLATERLGAICGEMLERWPLRKVAIVHRTGDLVVGEASVVVAASAPHRGDAFDACRHGIERLKEDVPIWKKESLVSGDAHWVMGS